MSIKWKTAGDNHYGVASHGKYHIGPAGKGSALSYMAHGKANYSPVSSLKAGARGDLKLAAALHHANMKRSSKKSMQYTQGETKMSKELESFEEIFKSDGDEAHCPTCGGEVEIVEKGGKKKMKARGVAKKIGNEMDPHKGGKTGTFVDHKRPGSLGSAVDRDHAKKPHAPRSGVVKSEGGEALFPQATTPFRLVQYTGLGEDAALAKQIEDSQDPQKAHSLYTPSMRNLAVENEGGE